MFDDDSDDHHDDADCHYYHFDDVVCVPFEWAIWQWFGCNLGLNVLLKRKEKIEWIQRHCFNVFQIQKHTKNSKTEHIQRASD